MRSWRPLSVPGKFTRSPLNLLSGYVWETEEEEEEEEETTITNKPGSGDLVVI